MMVLYIAVSHDRYELPIAVADSVKELGRIIGVDKCTVSSHITLANQGKIKKQKYFRIEVEDD